MVLKRVFPLLILLAALGLPAAWASDHYELKFATLAPEGSAWMNILDDWSKQVEQESQGRLQFKMYPGGVTGDEPDVLRKIRFGQLQAAAITGHGVGLIYPPARVMEMPFLFQNHQEIDYVRERLVPQLAPGFRAHGYQLLGWFEVGFVRFFSKEPIRSLAEMRRHRVWLWQGDPLAEAFFSVSRLTPIPLSITDVFTSLSTGLVDTVYAPPLAAIAMQWFTKTSYMSDVAMTDGIAALVISRSFFDRLPQDLQHLLTRTGNEAAHRLIIATRRDNEASVETLQEHGLEVAKWDQGDYGLVLELRDKAAKQLANRGYIPAALFDEVGAMLAEYRSSHKQSADGSASQ